ncbi:hypothetical protein JCM10450v2_007648 [Rhodotorula kratochvilovae]
MSAYGTPLHPSQRRTGPTQPPTTGPSLLSTPLRTPSALRPSLFHPRASPLSTSLSRASLNVTPAHATPRLLAPANTPASVRAAPPAGGNPFDALPAAAFDTFVSGLTSSIRAVLEPQKRGELPSERRRREREERAREREEAQRERERARREREARRAEEERLAREEEDAVRDVFGEVKVVDGGEGEGEISAADFARPASPPTAYAPLADLPLDTPSYAASSATADDEPEMREARLHSSLVSRPLFAPQSGGSASASDHEEQDEAREGTYGLDTAASSSAEEEEEGAERVWDEDAVGEGIEELDSAGAAAKASPELAAADEADAEAYAFGLASSSDGEDAPAQGEEEQDDDDPSAGEYYSAGDDAPVPGALVDYDGGSAMDSAEAEWAGRGAAAEEEEGGEEEGEEEEEMKLTKGGTELLELGSSSDDEGEPAPAPVARPPPKRATYGAPEPVAREQPHQHAHAPAPDAAQLAVLPPWLAPQELDEGEEDGGASSAAFADVEDEGEESEQEDGEGEWYGDGMPRDEVEMVREEVEEDEDERMNDGEGEERGRNPLEMLYADEDSEDVRPRIPYEAKGKARAPPTPSGDGTPRSSLSPSPSPSSDLDVDSALAHWSARGAAALRDLDPAELLETHDRLVADLQRAIECESEVGRLLVRQMEDVDAEFTRQTGLEIAEVDEGEEEEEGDGGERDPQDFALSDTDAEDTEDNGGARETYFVPPSKAGRAYDDDEEEEEEEGETYALPGSPLSARSASPLPPAVDDEGRSGSPDRSAYFPDLAAGERAREGDSVAAAEARLAEIAGELVHMREAGVQGGMTVLPGQEEDEEDEEMLVVEETVTSVVETFVQQQFEVFEPLDDAPPAPLEEGGEREPDVLVLDDAVQQPADVDVAQSSQETAELLQFDIVEPLRVDSGGDALEAAQALEVDQQDDLHVQPADLHASYAPTAPVEPAFHAQLAPSTAEAASTGEPHASLATLSAPHVSSHFRFEAVPTPALDSPIPYPPVHAEHNVDSPVHSDGDLGAGEDPTGEEAPIRVGVAEEEMHDGALVGRMVPLAMLEDGSPTRAREARDVDTPAAEEQGGLVIVDDDASLPPSRAPEPEPLEAQADEESHVRERVVLGATPPPEQDGDENLPPIVEGVAPPQNLDIVPAPVPRTPPPAGPVVQAVEQPAAPASPAAEPVKALTPSLASFAPSAPVEPAFDAPLAPTDAEAASTGDPHASLATLSAPHLSSHFRFEDVPTPPLDSPVPYPPVHTEHSVDSPVHEGDPSRGEEEAPLKVGVEAEELRDEALVGRARPLDSAVDASRMQVHEQEDVEMSGAEGAGGFVVIDDHAEIAPAAEEVAQVAQADVTEVDKPEAERMVLTATPPPAETTDEQPFPPIVDGVAPPQNPALVPAPAPSSPPSTVSAAPVADKVAPPPAAYPPFAPIKPIINAGFIPSTRPASHEDEPIAPSSALSPRHLSSHFQFSPCPAPALDSPVPYPPVHAEHSVDSPVHGDDLPHGEEDAPLRVGVEAEELRDEALVGRARPLGGAVDASIVQVHEQEDVDMGGAASEGGLVVIDDDAETVAVVEEVAQVARDTVDEFVKPETEPIVLSATPPPPPAEASEEQPSPPIVDGVAPPQNPALVPVPTPPSPGAQADEDAPAPVATTASQAVVKPQPADEIRFEDYLELDSSTDEEGDDSADEVHSALVPDRSRQTSHASEAPRTVLGLPAGEGAVISEATAPLAEDDDDEQDEPAAQPRNGDIEEYEHPLGLESVTETSTDAVEVGEEDQLAGDEVGEVSNAPRDAPSQAPSSEPISYRSEDERDELAILEPYGEEGDLAEQNGDELHDEHVEPHAPLHIHDVVEPGEWDPSEPIRFGDSSGIFEEQANEPTVEEPAEQNDAVRGGSAVVEVETDGEALQPSEVISARGTSVLSEQSLGDVNAQVVDLSAAADGVDGGAPRAASPVAPAALEKEDEPEIGPAPTSSDNAQDEIRIYRPSPRRSPPPPPQALDKVVEGIKARATPRRTRSAGKVGDEGATAETASPARRSGHLSVAPPTPSSSSSKPDTPAARKRARKSEAAEPSTAASSPAKRIRRSVSAKSQWEGTASTADSDDERPAGPSAPTGRVHHHHHAPSSAAGPSTRSRSSGAPRTSEAPLTRSHCDIVTLKLRSREAPRGPASVYVVRVPACALTSSVAQETMRALDVENLGPVDAAEHCEGVMLGGKAGAAESLYKALIPHGDVLTAVRRIVGPELWDEGVAEVLPQEERERAAAKGTPNGKGKKRVADGAPEDGGSAKGKRRK